MASPVTTPTKGGRAPSSTVTAEFLKTILVDHISTPKALAYPENKIHGVQPQAIVKQAALVKDLAKHDALCLKKTTLAKAFALVRENYGKAWKLDDEFSEAWVASMVNRLSTMLKHFREAKRKNAVWVKMHFSEIMEQTTAGVLKNPADGAVDPMAPYMDEEPDDADSEGPEDHDASDTANAQEGPLHNEPIWTTEWDAEGEKPCRKSLDGKVYEIGVRVYEPEGAEDGDMMNVAFNGEDGEIEMELSNMTVALWREKLAAGTCGAFGPPPPKEYPIFQNPDGEDLVIKPRSINKMPYLIVLENKKQILQIKIEEERGEDATAEIALAVVKMYSSGAIKKVEMRTKKNELMKASDKHALPPAHAKTVEGKGSDTAKPVEGKESAKGGEMASPKKGPTEDAEADKFDGDTVPGSANASFGMDHGKGDSTPGGDMAKQGQNKPKAKANTSPKQVLPAKRKSPEDDDDLCNMDLWVDSSDEDPFSW